MMRVGKDFRIGQAFYLTGKLRDYLVKRARRRSSADAPPKEAKRPVAESDRVKRG